MRDFLRGITVLLAIFSGFALGGVGTFFGLLYWDAYVMHDHDGQAGIGFIIIAFWVGLACAAISAILAVLWFRKKYLSEHPG